jgi:hypothetical protein
VATKFLRNAVERVRDQLLEAIRRYVDHRGPPDLSRPCRVQLDSTRVRMKSSWSPLERRPASACVAADPWWDLV